MYPSLLSVKFMVSFCPIVMCIYVYVQWEMLWRLVEEHPYSRARWGGGVCRVGWWKSLFFFCLEIARILKTWWTISSLASFHAPCWTLGKSWGIVYLLVWGNSLLHIPGTCPVTLTSWNDTLCYALTHLFFAFLFALLFWKLSQSFFL